MTATLELMIWVALNIIGCGVMFWSSLIAWERRLVIISDKRPVIKQQQLRRANKQIRNRIVGTFLFITGIIIGVIPMFGYQLQLNNGAWILIICVGVIVALAINDLYAEFQSK